MGKGKMIYLPPAIPEAGGRVGTVVTRAGELYLIPTSCITQESRPCTFLETTLLWELWTSQH